MPPASLSTLAVIIPGPITASAAAKRAQREGRARSARAPGGVARASASTMQHLFQDVVDGDDAEHPPSRVLHRKREEVVLRRLLGDVPDGIVRVEGSWMLVHEAEHEGLGLGDDDVAERE